MPILVKDNVSLRKRYLKSLDFISDFSPPQRLEGLPYTNLRWQILEGNHDYLVLQSIAINPSHYFKQTLEIRP